MILRQVLELLFPRNLIDKHDTQTSAFIQGTTDTLARGKEYLDTALTESRPETALITLPKWYEDFGLIYDPNEPVSQRRRHVTVVLSSVGGQNPEYLRRQLQFEFPGVDFVERTGEAISEPAWSYYSLIGTIDTECDRSELLTLVAKLFPAHLEYIDLVEVEETAEWAVCGIGRVGDGVCGVGPYS